MCTVGPKNTRQFEIAATRTSANQYAPAGKQIWCHFERLVSKTFQRVVANGARGLQISDDPTTKGYIIPTTTSTTTAAAAAMIDDDPQKKVDYDVVLQFAQQDACHECLHRFYMSRVGIRVLAVNIWPCDSNC
jgi:hypothetical protein